MVQEVAHAVAQGRAQRVAQVAACLLAQRGARWGASKMRAQVMARVRDQVMTQVMAQVKAQEVVQVRAREGGPQPGAGATCRALQARGERGGEWRHALHTAPLRLFQEGMRYAIVGLVVL